MQTLRKLYQKPGFCGPATVEMMYSVYDLAHSQDEIALTIGDVDRITERGCDISELARSVEQLTPDYVLVGKQFGTIADLRTLIETYQLPVGVEWRGRFLEPDGHIWEEGHYSLITEVNDSDGSLQIVDPYAPGTNLLSLNGLISIDVFKQRWWDTNPVQLSADAEIVELRDDQLLFVLVPKKQLNELSDLNLEPMQVAYTQITEG